MSDELREMVDRLYSVMPIATLFDILDDAGTRLMGRLYALAREEDDVAGKTRWMDEAAQVVAVKWSIDIDDRSGLVSMIRTWNARTQELANQTETAGRARQPVG
jgi:hypothetical protein